MIPALIRGVKFDANFLHAGSKINVAEHHVSLVSGRCNIYCSLKTINHQQCQTLTHKFVVVNNHHTKCAETRANTINLCRMDRYAEGITMVTTASLT